MKQWFSKVDAAYRGFISGMWFVYIVRQMVVTSGNIAESAFLLATLWVIINAVAHTLVSWIIDAHTIELINNLSTIAFGALPELIFISVVCVCYTHWSATIKQKSKVSLTWAILYTLPACFFAVITISAITTFVSTKGTEYISMDPVWLVIRCLSGWFYAVVNMLFQKLGEPHYSSRLTEKDTEISRLHAQIETISQDFQMQITELSDQLKASNHQVNLLAERSSSLNRDILALYPKVLSEWVEKGVKTTSVSEIESITGHSKQRINGAIRAGKLQKDNRNKELIRVSSVIEWLKSIPVIESSNNGHSDRDTDPLELSILSV